MALGQRAYIAGNFGLELDGMMAGWLLGWEGGMPTTEVVQEKLGTDHLVHKHIGGVKYEDVVLTVGTGMSKHFWQWVQNSFDRNYTRQNGAVVAANFDYKETSRLEFKQGLITQVTFPGLDASSKDAAKVTVKVTPEYSRNKVTPQGSSTVTFQGDRSKQIRWSPANFRLSIDGVDCSRVFKIEALTLNQKTTPYQIGELRDYQVEPVQVEYPNLVVTLPESHSKDFWDWYDDFVVNGNCTESNEKSGTLEYLDPTLAMTLFQLDFTRLGVFKVTQDKAEANAEAIRRVKFEMYAESIAFKYNDAAVFA
jgi:phage tail-like protein